MKSYRHLKSQLLKDRAVRAAYDALGPEFALIQKLIEKRIVSGLSQVELAKKMGTKQSAISRFESGNYNPTIRFLQKIASALDAKLKITIQT